MCTLTFWTKSSYHCFYAPHSLTLGAGRREKKKKREAIHSKALSHSYLTQFAAIKIPSSWCSSTQWSLISRTGTTRSFHFLRRDKEKNSKSQNILLQGISYLFTKPYYKNQTISSACNQLAKTIKKFSSKWKVFKISHTQIGRTSLPFWLPPFKSQLHSVDWLIAKS